MNEEIKWVVPPPPPSPDLRGEGVHVWRASLDIPSDEIGALSHLLSSDEVERADRFHFERDRNRFIASRAGLRRILGRYLNTDAAEIRFSYSERGKPALMRESGKTPLSFSLSHSHDLVIYSFTRNDLLGVDVELIRSMKDIDQLASRFFSERESRLVHSASGTEKWRIFFRIWTIKEAYLKAIGEGLAGLEDVEAILSTDPSCACGIRVNGPVDDGHSWMIRSIFPAEGYIAAIAARNRHGVEIDYFEG